MKNKVVTIESLSPSGHGISKNDWYILGAYPGDIVKAQIYKDTYEKIYAEIIEIVESSEHRIHTPMEKPFFNANAPWEYLNEEYENKIKKEIVHEIFKDKALLDISSGIITMDSKLESTHYRNKVAYSFMKNKSDQLSFALYTRGVSGVEKVPHTDNLLVHETLNKIGKQFLHFFNQKNVPLRSLKYLVLRYSYFTNTVVAQILVTETNRKKLPWKKTELDTFINQHKELNGILVSHSESGIRSSITTKDFYEVGNIEIHEKIFDKKYLYHPSQFFQIYPEAFSQILKDCENIITKIPNHKDYELLDLFAGVGIIGLHLSHLVKNVHGIEQSPLSKRYAHKNAKINSIDNFSFSEADVDEALLHIKSEQIMVVDPARSGLSDQALEKIREVKPEYIIYISCNPETQAENYYTLKDHYSIEWSQSYNLFPKTSHIEHVLFLNKK